MKTPPPEVRELLALPSEPGGRLTAFAPADYEPPQTTSGPMDWFPRCRWKVFGATNPDHAAALVMVKDAARKPAFLKVEEHVSGREFLVTGGAFGLL